MLDFVKEFQKLFTFQKKYTKFKYNLYNWDDSIYSEFMTHLFQSLEPRNAEAKEIIFNELDEASEYIFFTKG